MKTQIEKILEAESTAKQRIADAELKARDTLAKAREQAVRLVDTAKHEAHAQAKELLRKCKEKAESDKSRIIEETRKTTEKLSKDKSVIEPSWVAKAARNIAGLP